MKKRYKAALIGQGGMFKALRRAWASRFSSIQGLIMIPETDDALRLSVHYDAATECDRVTITHHNHRTGAESTLYDGRLLGGQPKQGRRLKD